MDFSNSVILPREDFIELSTVAWNQPTPTASERVAQTIQTSTVCLMLGAAVALGSWGWATAVEYADKKKFEREMQLAENKNIYTV